jgi:hypothetical protein
VNFFPSFRRYRSSIRRGISFGRQGTQMIGLKEHSAHRAPQKEQAGP